MKSRTLIVSFFILLLAVTLAAARTWTSGTHTIEGKFIGLTDDGATVRIEKKDGKRVKIALEKLSPEDREFVEGISSRSADDDPFEEDEVEEDRGLIVVPAGNQYALLIGVNEYAKPIASLKYCVNDMELLAESFEKIGVPKENIFLMTDDSPAEHRPTGTNIRKQIKDWTQLMGPNDQLTIAFSGHGAMVGEKSYLCPSDTNLDDKKSIISRDWAFEQMDKCKAKQKIFIIDACRDVVSFGGAKALGNAKTLEDPIGADKHGFILIASCDKTQKSWEDSELKHGVFTHFFAEGLMGAAKDEDGYVSVMNLFQYASSKTSKYVKREFNKVQVPTFRQGGEMTDFCIAKLTPETPTLTPAVKPAETSLSGSSRQAGDRKVLTAAGIDYAFRWCPPGEFTMPTFDVGKSELDKAKEGTWKNDYDVTQYPVKITEGFWLLETKVTQAMWESVMGESIASKAIQGTLNHDLYGIGDNYPMYYVSWDDCQVFCQKLSKKLGQKVQLPTEEQWVYAHQASPAGLWFSHPWGLQNMKDNIWEWGSNYYNTPSSNQPPTEPLINKEGIWMSASHVRLAPSSRLSFLGLRVLLVPSDEE